jgi:ribosomal protein L40E
MNAAFTPEPGQAHAAESLVAQRTQLQGWLDRLAAHADEMPEHVVERVRNDYLQRLQRVTEELSDHLDSLRHELARHEGELGDARQQQTDAVDGLAELKLRHVIGELTDEEWDGRRPELEQAVADAEETYERLAAEADRLRELVASVEAAGPSLAEADPFSAEAGQAARDDMGYLDSTRVADPSHENADVEADVEGIFAGWQTQAGPADDSDTLPWLEVDDAELAAETTTDAAAEDDSAYDDLEFLREMTDADAATAPAAEAGAETAAPEEDSGEDMAFLEELDRAIAASASALPQAEPMAPPAEAAAKTTLVCKECGASNDARAWYCEICGTELS